MEERSKQDLCGLNRLTRYFMKKTDILDPAPGKKRINYALLGFLIPFVGMCLMYLLMGIVFESQASYYVPGAKRVFSLLNSDAYHQYYPFFKAFRERILAGKSLVYCWDIGMGVDYLGLYAYYLGSPLNWLSILVPERWLLDFFTLLTPIRLGFAGMFFAIFLQKIFEKNDISIAVFGSFYATCAWVFGYLWNSMWLDTFALLPLVVLGTVSLLKDRKFILYTVSLFFSVFINYYMGFFTCIFTLLVFVCYEICRFKSIWRFLADLFLMGVFTVLALGATAALTLPAYASLLTTNAGDSMTFAQQLSLNTMDAAGDTAATTPTTTFQLYMTEREDQQGFTSWQTYLALFEGMTKVATNTFAYAIPNVVKNEGLPNIYCGVFANIFGLLFITCKQVKWRDRISAVCMLLFLNASFVIHNLNFIWHGFHEPNMIPYRFSFLYSFVMLYMAYRAFLLRRRIRPWQVITAGVVSVVMLVGSQGFALHRKLLEEPLTLYSVTDPSLLFPYVNLLLLAGYTAVLLILTVRKRLLAQNDKRNWYKRLRFRRNLGTFCLILLMGAELFLNFAFFAVSSSLVVDASGYPKGGEDAEKVVSYMQQQENDLFYRAETTHQQIFNDSSLNGYSGITAFTSSANVGVTNYLRALGYGAYPTYNRYCYEHASPLSNLFLNVKYMIERDVTAWNDPYFTDIYQSGNVHLLENNQYLPLGFLTDPQLAEISVKNAGNRFTFQNNLLSAALGEDVTAWEFVDGNALEISGSEDIKVSGISKYTVGCCDYESTGKAGVVSYVYSMEKAGFFSAFFSLSYPISSAAPTVKVYVDTGGGFSETPLFTDGYSLSYTLAVGQVNPGDRVKIEVTCAAGGHGSIQITGALLDEKVMEKAYRQLSQSTLTLTKFEDTLVEGTIDCEQAGLLYTSIPQTGENWHIYVDGQEAEITLIGEVMLGVALDEGSHTVTFRYENKAFQTGVKISIACIAVFAVICGLYVYRKKKK